MGIHTRGLIAIPARPSQLHLCARRNDDPKIDDRHANTVFVGEWVFKWLQIGKRDDVSSVQQIEHVRTRAKNVVIIRRETDEWCNRVRSNSPEGATESIEDQWLHARKIMQTIKRVEVRRLEARARIKLFSKQFGASVDAILVG